MASAIDLLEGKGPLEKPSADVLVGREGLPKTEYDDLMASASEEHGVPYEVLYRNIRQESGFNPKAVSKTGARGIAQFIPSTAKAMGIKDPHDPKQAIPGAARYIKQLYDQFGDWKLAIAAYNAGPEAVKRAKGIPKIKETINHVKAVFPDDDKEPSYKDSEGASEGFRFKSAMSLLEKAKPEIQQSIAEPIVNAQETGVSPKEFYTRNAFSPFGVMHPAMSAKIGRQGFGPKPEGGWDELGRPLDAAGEPYVKEGIKQEKVAEPIAETLKGLTSMAANPMEVIRGGLDFALSIPGFTVGLLGAAGRGGKEIASQLAYGTLDLDQVYTAMSKGMQESFEFFEPGKRMVVGEPTKVSQLVGEVAMAPMSAVMATGQKVAAAEMFKDSPNIRGAAKILGDGLGLMAMGLILHGPSRRAEFSREAEGIVKEAETLQAREVEISQGANSLVQEVQRKALEIEKQLLESKAAEFSKKFQDDVLLVEDAGRLAEDIAKSKIRPETYSRPEMAEDYVAKPVKLNKKEQAKVEKEQRKVEAEKPVEPATKESLQELIEANPELAGKIRVDALGEEGTTLLPGNAQVTILEAGKESTFTAKTDIADVVDKYKAKVGEYEAAERKVIPIKSKDIQKQEIIEQGLADIESGEGKSYPPDRVYDKIDSLLAPEYQNKKVPYFEATKTPKGINDTIGRLRDSIYNEYGGDTVNIFDKYLISLQSEGMSKRKAIRLAYWQATKPKLTVITIKKSGESVKKFKELEEPKVEAKETMSPELLKHLDSMIEESEAPVKSREKVTKLAEKEPEVITEIDKGTGSDVPSEVINDSFMRPLKDAENLDRIFKEREKALGENPEMYVQKLINDVRLWKHGKDIDIKAVRGALSEMGARAGELSHFFNTGVDHIQFMDVAREAAKWARGLKKPGNGIKLNMGIDINDIRKTLKNALRSPRHKVGDRIESVYSTSEGRFKGIIKRVIVNKTSPDTSTRFRYEVEWDNGRTETIGQNRIQSPSGSGVQLNIGIDLDKVARVLKDAIRRRNVEPDGMVYHFGDKVWPTKEIVSEKIKRSDINEFKDKLAKMEELERSGKGNDIEKVRDLLWNDSRETSAKSAIRFLSNKIAEKQQYIDDIKLANEVYEGGKSSGSGVQLNMMIPVDKIPDSVKFWFRYTKGIAEKIRASEVYRNKELWKSTGFWYGRDGKWRFELDDSGAKYAPSKNMLDNYKATGFASEKLTAVLDHPRLYEQVPKLKDATIVYDKSLPAKGEYRIDSNTVVLKAPHYKNTLFHEIAHGVNREANAFSGGSPGGVLAERFRGVIKDLKNVAKTDEVRREISDVEKSFNKGYIGLNEAAEHIMAIVDRRAPKSADKFAEKLNEILDAGSAFDEYLRIPGEMESRLTERRLNMSKEARMSEPPWQTLDRMLAHEGINPEVGRKLYSGLPVDEAAKAIVAGAKKVAEYTTKARGMKKFKPGAAFQKVREEFVRSAIDRSGNIRKDLIEVLGEDGYKVVQKMYLAKGASARSVKELKQMKAEVYEGLSVREKKILDDIILDDRMIDIAKYRGEGEFNFPKGLTPKDFIAHRTLFGEIEGLSKEQVAKLNQRASAYFEWMKKPLRDMLESGLISKEEFDKLASHNYRRIKLVDIFDKRYSTKVGDKKRTVYDSGVEALARGRETDIYEPSSEIMALEVFNRAYGRILNNEANKMLLELAEKDKENPFVRIKSKDRNEKIPSGWNRIFVFDKGERKSLWISPEMGKEWIIRSPEISYKMGQVLRYASGSPVLRTFATGINWGFALANIPRDVMHTWFTARTWKDGEWKPVYSPHAPIFALQMGRDIGNVFLDAALRKGRYNDYIDQGGGMEFLVHQGRLLQRGRHVDSKLGDVLDFMGYFGETSEIMTRLAIRDRVIRNEAKKRGISFEEASKDKDITAEATFAARDYMDFGQGGGISKAADNALPYLNAAIQGTRGIMRSFKPGSGSAMESTYKLAQFGTAVVGTYIAANALAPNTMKELQGNVDMQSNLCIPIGDQFSFEDEKGQTRYLYFKIPLDPGQKFFKTMFEGATDKWLGNEVDVNRITGTLNDMSPVGISQLPPTLSATLGYMSNKDFWLNEDIWKETDKPFGFVKSSEEFTGKTPQAYVDVGKVTGLSPERTKYAVEELITNGTIWSYLINQGYDAAFGDISKERKEQHIALALAKFPGFKRFIGVTNPYSKHAQKVDRAAEDTVVKRFVENRGMDMLVEGHLYGNVEREKVFEYARSFKDKDTYDRLIDRFKFEEAIRDLPEKSFWGRMKGLNLEAKARIFVERLNSANEEEKAKLMREYGIVAAAGGVVGKEFRREVSKLMAGE